MEFEKTETSQTHIDRIAGIPSLYAIHIARPKTLSNIEWDPLGQLPVLNDLRLIDFGIDIKTHWKLKRLLGDRVYVDP